MDRNKHKRISAVLLAAVVVGILAVAGWACFTADANAKTAWQAFGAAVAGVVACAGLCQAVVRSELSEAAKGAFCAMAVTLLVIGKVLMETILWGGNVGPDGVFVLIATLVPLFGASVYFGAVRERSSADAT